MTAEPDRQPAKASPYQETLRLAAERLGAADPEEVCRRSGARRTADGLELEYFGRIVGIRLPQAEILPEGIPLYERILILHYLTGAGGAPASGEYVQFKNLPGASFYEPAYRRRGTARLLRGFGDRPELLGEAAAALGGTPESYGDVSVRLRVFPKIEAVVVLYRGDDEFPPEAGILFRDDIPGFLALEDVTVVADLIAGRLERAKPGA